MPLEANIITRSGSGKENPILSFLRMTIGDGQHDGRAMVSMTFCRTVLFDEKKEVPVFAGLTAVS